MITFVKIGAEKQTGLRKGGATDSAITIWGKVENISSYYLILNCISAFIIIFSHFTFLYSCRLPYLFWFSLFLNLNSKISHFIHILFGFSSNSLYSLLPTNPFPVTTWLRPLSSPFLASEPCLRNELDDDDQFPYKCVLPKLGRIQNATQKFFSSSLIDSQL